MGRSDLDIRMKKYEKAGQRYLTIRTPVLLRLDGCHFHTFTRNLKRPFDEIFIKSIQETAKYLCENIQGATLAYCQSDEITILLVDYKTFDTSAWFDNRQNKIESVAAGMCSMAFNKFFRKNVDEFMGDNPEEVDYIQVLKQAIEVGAYFDCRAFNIPKEEVTNNFYWRQVDASRNSIQMLGQAHFSHDELHEKNRSMIQDMLMLQKGINWNDIPTYQKRGSCVIKEEYWVDGNGNELSDAEYVEGATLRSRWVIDKEIPIFKGEGRKYIDKLVDVGA